MERIPKPVLSQIFTWVGPSYELIQLALVCKRWKNAIEAAYHNISFQGTHIRKFQSSNIDIKGVVSMLSNKSISFKIQSLDLRNIKLVKSDIVQIFASQPGLLKLNLTNVYIKLNGLWKAILMQKNLKNKEIPVKLDFRLEELRISNNKHGPVGYDTLIKIFPNLKKLYAGNTNTSRKDFINIVKGLKKLELLDITNCYNIGQRDKSLNELKEAFSGSSIKKLFITYLDPKTTNYLEECHIEIVDKWIGTILDKLNDKTDLQYLENCLNLGIDVDLGNFKNFTIKGNIFPCWELIRSNKNEDLITEAFKIMIRYGLDLCFYFFEYGFTLMNAAISVGNYNLVDLFLKYKVDIWPYNQFQGFPIKKRKDNWDLFFDLDHQSWSASQNFEAMPAVTYASYCGNVRIFQLFLKYNLYPKDFDFKTFCNPICAALRNSQNEMFEFLKQNNFSYFNCYRHNEPWISNTKIIDMMIENADYFPLDILHKSTRYYIRQGNIEIDSKIYDTFIKKGIAENQQEILRNLINNDSNKPIIVLATEHSCQKMIEKVLESGFDINATNKFGKTALIAASFCGNKDLLVYLLNHGAIIDKKDNLGRTALHYAAEHGYLEIIKHLIRLGADPSSISNEGYSPLDLAALRDKTEAYNLLKSLGATSQKCNYCRLFLMTKLKKVQKIQN